MLALSQRTTEIVQSKTWDNVCWEKIGNAIVRVCFESSVFEIGDRVRFIKENCRIPVGTIGFIVRIRPPYQSNATSNIIDVIFQGFGFTLSHKPKELEVLK